MGRHSRLLVVLALAAWAGEASGAVVGASGLKRGSYF